MLAGHFVARLSQRSFEYFMFKHISILQTLLTAAAVAAASVCSAASSAIPSGFTHVRTEQGISEYRLDANGLTVLLLPDHSAPAVTMMVTYRVGSRNESYGTTGATHLLEHLMFKGTREHNRDAGNGYDQLLERTGAMTNATTSLDRTNYYETVGSQDLPLAVMLEADRMRNLRLREQDRRPEMTVVRNEYERGENNPAEALEKEMWAAAFIAHPYHHIDDRLAQRLRKSADREAARVLRHVLLAEQRDSFDHRRFRSGGGFGAGQEVLRLDSAIAETDSGGVHRGAAANGAAPCDRAAAR